MDACHISSKFGRVDIVLSSSKIYETRSLINIFNLEGCVNVQVHRMCFILICY